MLRRLELLGIGAAVGVLAAIVLGATLYLSRTQGYRTAIGQQQLLSLSDDTRVHKAFLDLISNHNQT